MFSYNPIFRHGHLLTLLAWARPRRLPGLPAAVERRFRTSEDTTVVASCHWQAAPRTRTTLLLLHGLEGSSDAHYMRGVADKAWRAGMNIVRLNQRNCGGTEHLTPGLYHSGLTADPRAVIDELIATDALPAIVLAGYSMGGNVMLRLAGEYGAAAPAAVKGVVAVSPVIELEACVTALERPANRIYEWNFLRNLRARMRRKSGVFPGVFDVALLSRIRSIRAFDEAFTAPHHGFGSAADYYHRASALRVIGDVAIPALIISAEDDPFVPAEIFGDPTLRGNAHVRVELLPYGGHCAFIAKRGPDEAGRADETFDGYWAEAAIVDFARRVTAVPSSAPRTPAPSRIPRA